MDTMAAYQMRLMNRGKPLMVFDWDKAAKIIAERKPFSAGAGLEDDWEYTGGTIYAGGKIIAREDTYTYLASIWATPQLCIDDEYIDCYRLQKDVPGWDADTYWPDSARAILAAA